MASWAKSVQDEKALEGTLDEQEREAVELLRNGRPVVVAADEGDLELQVEANHHHQPAARVGVRLPTCCYKEIKTLLWIQNSVVHSAALQEWEPKSQLLTARVERKRKLGLHQRNEIYNLVGFFSVFQGVLLTAVSQSNLLHCNNWWSPFVLSVLASLVTFVGVLQKFWYVCAWTRLSTPKKLR